MIVGPIGRTQHLELNVLAKIERYLRRTGMSPTTFGRRAANDPRFVFDLRKGRCCSDRVEYKAYKFMQDNHHG